MSGLNEPQKQKRLQSALTICLLETHVKKEKQSTILSNVLLGLHYMEITSMQIWVLFDDKIRLSVYRSSKQGIHCHIFSEDLKMYFFLSVIYASNNHVEKKVLWTELCVVKACMP